MERKPLSLPNAQRLFFCRAFLCGGSGISRTSVAFTARESVNAHGQHSHDLADVVEIEREGQ